MSAREDGIPATSAGQWARGAIEELAPMQAIGELYKGWVPDRAGEQVGGCLSVEISDATGDGANLMGDGASGCLSWTCWSKDRRLLCVKRNSWM